jgi:proline iminopeptidase
MRFVLALLLVALAGTAQAAEFQAGGARRLGTKLTYEIASPAAVYRFVASVLSTANGVQYEWFTTSPRVADGIRLVPAGLLADSDTYCECYRAGEFGGSLSATSLWLSRHLFEGLRAGEATARFAEGGLAQVLTLLRRESYVVFIDNERTEVPALVARASAGMTLWVKDDPNDPLVLALEGTQQFHLRDVRQRRDDEIGRFVPVAGSNVHIVERGQGPPLFVLHGGPGMEGNYFRPYLEPLEAGFRVVYVDQPGQGLSERFGPRRPYTMTQAVEAIEALRLALGYERVALLGHSYGGFVAQVYAQRFPQHLSALVLVDTAAAADWNAEANANISRLATPEQRGLGQALSDDERIRRVFALYFDPPAPDLADAFMDKVILSAGAWRQLVASVEFQTFDMRPHHAAMVMPTLVVVGENDLITTPHQARTIAAGIPGARLAVFPHTGHNPFVEEPADFNALVADFLRGVR